MMPGRHCNLPVRSGPNRLLLVSGPRRGHIQSHVRRLLVDAVKALAEDAAELGVALALLPMSPWSVPIARS